MTKNFTTDQSLLLSPDDNWNFELHGTYLPSNGICNQLVTSVAMTSNGGFSNSVEGPVHSTVAVTEPWQLRFSAEDSEPLSLAGAPTFDVPLMRSYFATHVTLYCSSKNKKHVAAAYSNMHNNWTLFVCDYAENRNLHEKLHSGYLNYPPGIIEMTRSESQKSPSPMRWLYNTCILPISLGSYKETDAQDWCSWSAVYTNAARN